LLPLRIKSISGLYDKLASKLNNTNKFQNL
jgi:hypothetical protein